VPLVPTGFLLARSPVGGPWSLVMNWCPVQAARHDTLAEVNGL
jgi:hypothetical protein